MQKAQQLGRYQLLDRIAFGGMAEIYRAKTFDRSGRPHMVAVKRVLDHLTSDGEFIQMLVDEAKVTASLRHENIARLYEFSHTEDDEYFIAMEWVDGKDVRSILERHRHRKQPLPPEHCAWVVMEVANALDAAHRQKDAQGQALQIVHRDVSPSNMLCSYAGEVKLCDFGIAKATTSRVQTRTGVIKGKVKYMSPEQALGRKLDHRSDLFSLGTVLYEMLTLEAPFAAPTEVELIFAVRDAHKRDARTVVRTIPAEINAVVDKAMTKSRSQRYQSGKEMAHDLRRFLDDYKPGYRRSHFARFMRQEFAEEIEKELRLLEDFVIEDVDVNKFGENLIADALGPDALYKEFTAGTGVAAPEDVQDTERPISKANLHVEETRILHVIGPDVHAQETRIFQVQSDGRPARASRPGPSDFDEELELEPSLLPPLPPLPAPASVHLRPTQAFEQPLVSQIHSLETQILRLPELARKPTSNGPKGHPKANDGHASAKVYVDPSIEEEEDTTSVPLKDSDLEEQ